MRNKISKETNELMSKNPNNWKGVFYVNRKDPRLLVPKINPSLGWTLNFGNIYAYLGLIAIILIIIASQYYF
jgi:uncharacterized membrane protein